MLHERWVGHAACFGFGFGFGFDFDFDFDFDSNFAFDSHTESARVRSQRQFDPGSARDSRTGP
ncbi:hypothetical protein BN2475_1150006 [Paraburkholderia ribeironis]|uniref:Uncharacterized protein n=1 Tax=Paraburkholderia ribeironis TaxID=1247936 RepID=A0A1N7SPG2_9BURK|nr:hypothetical protein BN2475_1150006 [Paraburkholderia ribeironis]